MDKARESEQGGRYNRDDDMKPHEDGKPPRPSTEPDHAKGSSSTSKTATDPATGEPNTAGRDKPS